MYLPKMDGGKMVYMTEFVVPLGIYLGLKSFCSAPDPVINGGRKPLYKWPCRCITGVISYETVVVKNFQ